MTEADSLESWPGQIEDHLRTIGALRDQIDLLESIADRIIMIFREGGRVYLLGNGGSAADAQHIAAELVGRFRVNRRPLPAVALTTDSSILTAVANDFGADECFARQVEALVTNRDAVWALSVSGRSTNVLRGLDSARKVGALCIGFTGRGGDLLRSRCDHCLMVDHERADRVQEAHQLAYHLVCDRVERSYLR